jgi:carbamoyltransferase
MKIAGVWSGHDCSFCVLDDGKPTIHAEYERYNREKSPAGDSINFMFDRIKKDCDSIVHIASVHPNKKLKQYSDSYQKAEEIVKKNGGKIHYFSHHKAHAANAFYSSNLKESIVITIDGGGVEDDNGAETACTIWYGNNNDLKHVHSFKPHQVNLGGVWTRVTRYVFKLQNGWPLGGEEGTVMAMAAFGDSKKYYEDFYRMLTVDILPSSVKPHDQPVGATSDKDPKHPYLEPWAVIARNSEQDQFDLAAGLQSATETVLRQIIQFAIDKIPNCRNVCISGGVSLNSVAMGKIKSWFKNSIEQIYIPPVPYDGGLSIGAAQILWHEILGNPRIDWNKNASPYLGEIWERRHFDETIEKYPVEIEECDISKLVDLLADANIIAVFNEGSESGRRALGNRSILADPRNPNMRDIINHKVKHRKWFRPFAPSILESAVNDWFNEYQESPYMQFVLNFKDEKKHLVPAVVHQDGTARLQTVRPEDNKWYHEFLTKWNEKSGVPIILNTSFNDREPICENVEHSVKCFLGTNIDYLYFPQYSLILKRKIT